MKDGLQDAKKKLRGYLKSYRICQEQAEEIGKQLNSGEIAESVQDLLIEAKRGFEKHCRNVQIILSYLPFGTVMYYVMTKRYKRGLSMKSIAEEIGYSVGYCNNVESNAIEYLTGRKQIMEILEKL